MAIIPGNSGTPATFPDGFQVSDGSVTAPTFKFSDAQTGFYRPGTNQIALSTAGVQRMLVDASGNVAFDTNTLFVDAANNRVGVGTASPGQKFHLENTGTVTALIKTTNNAQRSLLSLEAKTGAAADTSLILGAYGDGGDVAQITASGSLNIRAGGGTNGVVVASTGAVTLGPTGTAFNGSNPIHNVCGNLWFGTVSGTAYSGEFAIGVNTRVGSGAGLAARTNNATTGTAIYIANVASDTSGDAFSVRTNNATDSTGTTAKTIIAASAAGAWTLTQIHNLGAGNITSGTYTPTVTEGTNVTTGNKGTAQVSHYTRVGNTVTVSARINGTTTTAGAPTLSRIYVSLPIASNFTDADDGHGCGTFYRGTATINANPIIASARISPDEIELIWNSTSTSSHDIFFTFQYEVK